MIYLLTFFIVVLLVSLIRKRIEVKRQKRIILMHELARQKVNLVLNKITLYNDLPSQIEALEYILQNLEKNETTRNIPESSR